MNASASSFGTSVEGIRPRRRVFGKRPTVAASIHADGAREDDALDPSGLCRVDDGRGPANVDLMVSLLKSARGFSTWSRAAR